MSTSAKTPAHGSTTDTDLQNQVDYLTHALTQVLELSQRHSEHFGAPRKDITERAKESLAVAQSALFAYRYSIGEVVKCNVCGIVAQGEVVQRSHIEGRKQTRNRYVVHVPAINDDMEPWETSLIECEPLLLGHTFK
jgi:hypothetical protein